MPSISQRGKLMPESPIRKLVPYAEKAGQNGIHVYHLNIGQPDIETPKVALDAVIQNRIKILEYARSEGSETYRQKLCEYYAKNDIHVNSDEITVTTGGSEALMFALGSVCDKDDEIIIPQPFYANYNGFAIASGIKVVPVMSHIEDNFALPNLSDFEERITDKTKAILICNPGNPTGYLYSEEEIKKLAGLAVKHDIFLIADEVYREFIYEDQTHYSILQEPGLENHAIVVDSVSKRYSMCGARIGCLVSKNPMVNHTALKFAQARLSPPTYALLASEAALDTPDRYFKDVITEYSERRNTLIELLQQVDGVQVAKPRGAFYCMAKLPVDDTDEFARWMLEHFQKDGCTLMMAPASGFYVNPQAGKQQVRLAYVLKKQALVKSVELLDYGLKAYNKVYAL